MRCFPAAALCLLLFASVSYAAAPAPGSVTITVPGVPRPLYPPPPEYLLTPPVPPGSGPAWRLSQENVLREAAFRWLFTAFPPEAYWQPEVYFLAVQSLPWEQGASESRDPAPALLERFRGSKHPVEGVSALLRDKHWNRTARHRWVIYCVSSFHWVSDTVAEIYTEKSLPGSFEGDSIRLTCTLKNGWEITTYVEAAA